MGNAIVTPVTESKGLGGERGRGEEGREERGEGRGDRRGVERGGGTEWKGDK